MKVTARHKYLRMSAQKVRLVLPAVRGQRPALALAQLRLMPQAAALPVAKVIRSAVANAEHNNLLNSETLLITSASADVGPTMKRYAAAARGRAATIRRRSAHVTIVIEDTAPVPARGSAVQRAIQAVPKRRAKTEAPKTETDKAGKTNEVKEEAKPAKKPVTKAKARQKSAPPEVTKATPENKEVGKSGTVAKGAPRRTSQQTGRDSNSRKDG